MDYAKIHGFWLKKDVSSLDPDSRMKTKCPVLLDLCQNPLKFVDLTCQNPHVFKLKSTQHNEKMVNPQI